MTRITRAPPGPCSTICRATKRVGGDALRRGDRRGARLNLGDKARGRRFGRRRQLGEIGDRTRDVLARDLIIKARHDRSRVIARRVADRADSARTAGARPQPLHEVAFRR
jgi:hypothetical protein